MIKIQSRYGLKYLFIMFLTECTSCTLNAMHGVVYVHIIIQLMSPHNLSSTHVTKHNSHHVRPSNNDHDMCLSARKKAPPHNIANKIKNKDPDAMAAISLLKDGN